jgi:hypothetical protein
MARKTKPPETITGDAAIQAIAQMEKDAEQTTAQVNLPDLIKEVKRRKPSTSQRDPDNLKVIRRGRNLSGNQPFARKYYGLAPEVMDESSFTAEYQAALDAAPMQVRLILKYMRHAGIDQLNPEQGGPIVQGAINKRFIVTKISPPSLFAYYRRVMERLGLRLVSSEGLDGDAVEVEEEDGEE